MSDLHTYSAGGPAHQLLEMLERGPVTLSQFRETRPTAGLRRKVWFLTGAMLSDKLIRRAGHELYEITDDGRDALRDLSAGRDVVAGETAPSVRIFTNTQAERAA